ncbi:aminotransferase-like domain-containing protein [Variovorax arabinosiphilus]|uniref:aminotransferase-like domain-containing protein n=1 Tax=Variovorax arabinosiphilus TaxID=3053498 RepID=UPI00257594C8|nr:MULTISPECIES: PLP-dependent aminotransferase family protein [unclassified Variovorax]MDM0123050.1 PLP-dependent aminotransferase family protein [Variovorax sp. J2L1-78]MDM0131954.1 PLP-dependent aminotransferase family protein [Variovorax sp. J2L1-63]MDM0235813.1 PLP-dependent aminotransferase family protein [Variovorax sp. J2R1-6]
MAGMAGPVYLRIVQLLGQDIREGLLRPGDSLPSQRALAKQLGINFTTVTRGYDEAKSLGLVQSHHGKGTFVSEARDIARNGLEVRPGAEGRAPIDLTSTWPPNLEIAATLAAEVRQLAQERSFDFLARRGGTVAALDLAAGESWLQPRFAQPIEGRMAMASGTRNALIALLSSLVGSGGSLLVEAMIWPTVRTLATVLGIKLVPVRLDEEGLVPEALEQAALASQATVLYCVPTVQNPTGAVMGLRRRHALIEVARRRGLTLIEDDAYGSLQADPPPLLATLAPDITYAIFGLAKLLSPSMRVSYVVAPDPPRTARLVELLRATMQAAPPLEAALATRLINSGTLARLIGQIRAEAQVRQQTAQRLLAGSSVVIPDAGLFLWLSLPDEWSASDFAGRLRHEGVLIAEGSAFALEGADARNAVRIATGAADSRERLEQALEQIRSLLQQNASLLNVID